MGLYVCCNADGTMSQDLTASFISLSIHGLMFTYVFQVVGLLRDDNECILWR
jgi:hypothetical protein